MFFQNWSKTPQKASECYKNVEKAPENSTAFLHIYLKQKKLPKSSQILEKFQSGDIFAGIPVNNTCFCSVFGMKILKNWFIFHHHAPRYDEDSLVRRREKMEWEGRRKSILFAYERDSYFSSSSALNM